MPELNPDAAALDALTTALYERLMARLNPVAPPESCVVIAVKVVVVRDPIERLMTVEEVAEVLRTSDDTLRRMRHSGELLAVEKGSAVAYRPETVRKYIESHEGKGHAETRPAARASRHRPR